MGVHDRNAISAAAFLTVTIAATQAHAASFDCTKAAAAMEHLICSDASLGARDAILSKLYIAALRRDATGRIRAGQREWLAKAGACMTVECLGKAYDERVDALMRTKGGEEAIAHFYTEEPEGNHGTLDVIGPTDGFAYVSLISTFVAPGGEETGNINASNTGAFLDLRHGNAEFEDTRTTEGDCLVSVRPLGEGWKVEQRGTCDLPSGTVFAGTYRR